MTLWARCGEGTSNARLEPVLENFLGAVTNEAPLHARFLNTLSLLEHIGSRKIMLSQMRGGLDKETLKHLAEETRHAFFFKHQAERMAGHALENYDAASTLCPAEAKNYFGRLDAGLTQLLKPRVKRAPYLWVSFIIELRAGWVYRFYEKALVQAGAPFSLKSVTAEEEKHLRDMQESLQASGLMDDLLLARAVALETKLFTHLLNAITAQAKIFSAATDAHSHLAQA